MRALHDFILNKMKIPAGLLEEKDISFIRRVRATKRTKVIKEVIVSFSSVEARDLVQSYARNLGEWIGEDGRPLAGMRLEIPEKLMGDFKACENYGHAMKKKHGAGFKRHTKLDDAELCLYMDLYLPKKKQWTRVDMAAICVDNGARRKRNVSVDDEDLRTTGEEKTTEDK